MAEEPIRPPASEPVPLQDPRREYAELRARIDEAVARVAESGRFVLGPEVEAFEEAFADRIGARHAVSVNSGTDALVLALDALGVGPGDEVVTSPFSFFATAEAILRLGATPVFADVRPDTLNLDPAAAAGAITDRTAALLPVHLYGQMADVAAFRELAAGLGLALIEDAAQAHGAERDGLAAGAAGDVACFSFYPTKNLGAWGDGGLVSTDDDAVAERLRGLRDHGREAAGGYGHREVGYNSRLDALQAAVLGVKLGALDRWNDRRREHAAVYDAALDEHPVIAAPVALSGAGHVYHQYTVRAPDRAALRELLEERGIGHAVYYPVPLHLQEALADLGHEPGAFPESERAAEEVVSLPVFPGLKEDERARVVAALEAFEG